MNTSPARAVIIVVVFAASLTIAPIWAEDRPAPRSSQVFATKSPYPTVHSAESMIAHLAKAPEISLLPYGDSMPLYKDRPKSGTEHPVLDELDFRPDLRGLPVLRGDACRLSPVQAARFSAVARSMRTTFLNLGQDIKSNHYSHSRANQSLLQFDKEMDGPLMLQMLQCENETLRRLLHEQLANSRGPIAAKALAQRVVYELDPKLRREALQLLQARGLTPEARQFLLDSLRYPYAPIADHASAALSHLQDVGVVPALIALLDAPNPSSPFADADGSLKVKDIVRVNHARNCLLCHAPSWDRSDAARIRVPAVHEPLPDSFAIEYYNSNGPGPFVRADVTYLRQDFSLVLPVEKPGPWPKAQRFDFFVKVRPAFPYEADARNSSPEYPQRYAVLRALRGITKRDYGADSESWRKGLNLMGRFKL